MAMHVREPAEVKWTDKDGVEYVQYKRLFCVTIRRRRLSSDGDAYLMYLRKGGGLGGSALLRMAERVAAVELGARRLYLQDAAHVECARDGPIEFDLGFRSMLAHGRTWYEIQGYQPVWSTTLRSDSRLVAVRLGVGAAVRAYRALRVKDISDAVELQVSALRKSEVAAPSSPTSRTLFFAHANADSGVPKAKANAVLGARVKLRALLRGAPAGARLGEWLLSLGCEDYAFFMSAVYGTRAGPGVAIAAAGGVRTPGLAEFKRANWLRRNSHRLSWIRVLLPRR